ncbi:hypothetical protein GWK36_05400 [Caldichromatium japonicum]|uniref:Uncharacterized protein n=1 Tax=Caldichromatium japonicum TaxID=2699430 RepID=A0A6G7VCA3_9GAMM|nr:hypothetical protein [Caldichromatium japonicum]QIK37506.1 hypothetical protein GWK36_05400 [Caldichromatium japonicum]
MRFGFWLGVLYGALALVGQPAGAVGECRQGMAVRVWTAPLMVRPGQPLAVMAVATDGVLDAILVTDPAGRIEVLPSRPGGGPPWSLQGTLFRVEAGPYRLTALRAGQAVGCTEIDVGQGMGERGSGRWDEATEAFFSAWIEHLFAAPPDETLSLDSLAPILRDPVHNLLFNYLGLNEDDSLRAEPDCADLPYYLRAYFAWKLGLPISYRPCSRGTSTAPPRCQAPIIDARFVGVRAPSKSFREAVRRLMDTVHSGNGRTALDDNATDLYPLALERGSLWPGTVYADPYGHTLILVKWLPGDGKTPGRLLAVDAQPDNSVTRKRYWEGNFLFAETPSAGPGFKAFRPLVQAGGGWRPLSNAELTGHGARPFSLEQRYLDADQFYARLEQLINPGGLDPISAYDALLAALIEQIETRVQSVENGARYLSQNPGAVIPMPSGPAIFETTGPWEDYSTPSRDLRLLIALKVVEGLAQRIRRYPELYTLGGEGPDSAAARVEQRHQQALDRQAVVYTRSDGSPWRLTLRELYVRRANLEMAYNPNDCIELRWGAEPGSAEAATCRRRAPAEQRVRMEQYRIWFRTTTRPPR